MSPLHPRMAEIVERLGATHRALHDAVDGLSDAAAARRSSPERWSVAEIVDHLRRAETGTVRLLLHLNHKAQALGAETASGPVEMPSAARLIPGRAARLQSPAPTLPDPAVTLSEALAGFDAARDELLQTIAGSAGRAVGALHFPHPLLGEFDYYQWVRFTAEHEARHTEQVLEARRELGLGLGR